MYLVWIWMFVGASLVIFKAPEAFVPDPETSQLFPDFDVPNQVAITAVALIDFGLSFLLPRVLLARVSSFRGGRNAEKSISRLYWVSRVIGWALAQGITLMGIVLTVFTRSDRIMLPFFALTLLSLLLNGPKEKERNELLRRGGVRI
jgi:hypothetical protein